MTPRDRTTHFPAFYRVSFPTVSGLCWRDTRSLETARRIAKAESNHLGKARIQACWYVEGALTLDTETVR